MKAIAKIYANQSRSKAAEFRAKASSASGMPKAGYLDLAAMHDRQALTWELLAS